MGVRGRDPMDVRVLAGQDAGDTTLASVPFYQSWYGTSRSASSPSGSSSNWENFTIRRNLQDFPGRVLPITRAFYGIRWTLWN